jgi:hypothetical protein
VVQTFPTNRADESLDIGVLPRRLRCSQNFPHAEPLPRTSLRSFHRGRAGGIAGRCPTERPRAVGERPIQTSDIPSPQHAPAFSDRATRSRRRTSLGRTQSAPRRNQTKPDPLCGLLGTCATSARAASVAAPCTSRPWLPIARIRVSAILRECEARPGEGWRCSSCGSDRSLPSIRKAGLVDGDSSRPSTAGIPIGARRSPFPVSRSRGQIASRSTVVTPKPKGGGRQHSAGACDIGWLFEGLAADVEGQRSRLGAWLEF